MRRSNLVVGFIFLSRSRVAARELDRWASLSHGLVGRREYVRLEAIKSFNFMTARTQHLAFFDFLFCVFDAFRKTDIKLFLPFDVIKLQSGMMRTVSALRASLRQLVIPNERLNAISPINSLHSQLGFIALALATLLIPSRPLAGRCPLTSPCVAVFICAAWRAEFLIWMRVIDAYSTLLTSLFHGLQET